MDMQASKPEERYLEDANDGESGNEDDSSEDEHDSNEDDDGTMTRRRYGRRKQWRRQYRVCLTFTSMLIATLQRRELDVNSKCYTTGPVTFKMAMDIPSGQKNYGDSSYGWKSLYAKLSKVPLRRKRHPRNRR
jgi:hypothetical protein